MSKPREPQRLSVDQILNNFEAKKALLSACAETTRGLIEQFLNDASIQFQSIQSRVKSSEKLRTKVSEAGKSYGTLDDITDLVGVRVITYYEDEVDKAAEVLKREFDIDVENSVDKRETEPNRFGYYALNYICSYANQRLAQTEYKRYAGLRFEVQITSILRHAWSEIEHPWYDLKDAFPNHIKRRFARMAALLEVAESEFLSLRQAQADYTRSVAVQVAAGISDLPLNGISIASLVEEPLVRDTDAVIAEIFKAPISADTPGDMFERRAKAADLAGLTTVQSVRDGLTKYSKAVPELSGAAQPRSGQVRYRAFSSGRASQYTILVISW